MNKDTIYWYDFETTGTDPALDRAIQFAGVRTDLDLNVIGEPLNLYCLPGNDNLPHPEAILVTHIGYEILRQKGLNEADFIRRIHDVFSVPNTCVAGFNSIRFDDEFTRNLLYRNFFDAYQREWQNGNSRWDIIDLFRTAHALRPDGFVWPKNADGNTSFRLELMTEQNGISHESAHDAVSDVLATIAVARKLREAQPKLYDYMFDLRRKPAVVRQLYPLGKAPVVHISSMYPASRHCLSVVLPICVHPTNSNGVICFDLDQDPEDLINLDAATIGARIFTSTADLPEGVKRIGLKTIHINKCPALAPLSTLKGQESRLGIDLDRYQQHMRLIQRSAGMVEKISEVFSKHRFVDSDDPDRMLYQGGFFSANDKTVMADVRQARAEDLMSYDNQFEDGRLSEMLFRYKARNHADALTPSEQQRWDVYRRDVFNGESALVDRLSRFEALIAENPGVTSLEEWKTYLKTLEDL